MGMETIIPAKKARFTFRGVSPNKNSTAFPNPALAKKATKYTISHRNACFLIEKSFAENVIFLLIIKLKIIEITHPVANEKINKELIL
jgi:hypothetical protein